MMSRMIVVIGVLMFFGVEASAQQKRRDDKFPKPVTTDKFMKAKLKLSTLIVEGLALDEFKKIESGAEALLAMSQEADWNTLKTEAYLKMSEEFRASTRRLQKTVETRNLEAATLAYFEVTMNCVRCHKYVRGKK